MDTKPDQFRNSAVVGKPTVIFDGDCSFCRTIIDRWRSATGERILYEPYQVAAGRYPHISERAFRHAVHFADQEGRVSRGAEAVLRTAAECGRKQWLLWLYLYLPPVSLVFDLLYRLVAKNRKPLTLLRRVWYGKDLKLPTYHIASAIFLRLMGIIYLIAFVSLWTQITGLVGEHGILPVDKYLAAADQHFAQEAPPESPVWNVPTLVWLSPHDWFLNLVCATGTVLSLLLILGVLPMLTLALLWICYLSAFQAGQIFLGFQWDILLLETGLVAIFLAPSGWRSKFLSDRHPPRLAIWLVWWLLFRLMFESGAVKLTWNAWAMGPDGTPLANSWKSLTALEYHYWTQPLPAWTSWYMAPLPHWFQKASVLFVFGVELGLPWLICGPRLLRAVACGGIVLLMVLIGATGNYNFFNLLTIALAVMLLDDKLWPKFLRQRIQGTDYPVLFSPTRWRSLVLIPFVMFAMWIGGSQLIDAVRPSKEVNESLESRLHLAQFFLVNPYGLFRQMTETRPEIVIEGSVDGNDWKPFEFRWKPGDLARAPQFCQPHQPRLDWQMWFEALRLEQVYNATKDVNPRYMSPWFQSFLMQLLRGQPQVMALLDANPFPNAPPKFVRVCLYQYFFTDQNEWRQTKDWWHRDQLWLGPGWSLAPDK